MQVETRTNDYRLKESTLVPLVSGQMSSCTKDSVWSHRRLFCRSGWESWGPLRFHMRPTRQLSPARLYIVPAMGRSESRQRASTQALRERHIQQKPPPPWNWIRLCPCGAKWQLSALINGINHLQNLKEQLTRIENSCWDFTSLCIYVTSLQFLVLKKIGLMLFWGPLTRKVFSCGICFTFHMIWIFTGLPF